MANSPEYRAVVANNEELVDAIEVNVPRYAGKLFGEELITNEVNNIAVKTMREEGERARKVVQNIGAQIKAQPSLFPKLLEVLRAMGLKAQADAIEGKYKELNGTTSPPPSQEDKRPLKDKDSDPTAQHPRSTGEEPFEYLDLPDKGKLDYQSVYKDIRYVLTVAVDNEFKAATTMISSLTEYSPRVYVGKVGEYPIGLIRTEKGSDSLSNLQKCIPKFPNVKYLVAVGVCYGNSREDVKFGDVIISNEIQATGPAQYTQEGFVPRGGSKLMHPDIRHIFCDDRDFVPKFQVSKSGRNAKYYAKKILSAPWVNDDPEMKKKLMNAAINAYGGEMEGEALTKLQDDYPHIQVIVIKAVTDYGDGTKNKEWQLIGAQAAFHYVKHKIIEKSGLPETTSGISEREAPGSSEAGPGKMVKKDSDGDIVSKTDGASKGDLQQKGNANGEAKGSNYTDKITAQLGEEDHRDVYSELISIKAKWDDFLKVLKVPLWEIEAFKEDLRGNVQKCLSEGLLYWLRGNTQDDPDIPDAPKVNWESIFKALRDSTVNRKDLAQKIEKKLKEE